MSMRFPQKRSPSGIGFVEIMIAIMLAAVCGIPIYLSVTSSRTETSKAINYLRAVELANEVIEWATVMPFDKLDEALLSGHALSLVEPAASGYSPVAIKTTDPVYTQWKADGLMAAGLRYPEQYNNAFFFRTVKIRTVEEPGLIAGNLLKEITVDVAWNEGQTPANPNVGTDRMRRISLSTYIYNDEKVVD